MNEPLDIPAMILAQRRLFAKACGGPTRRIRASWTAKRLHPCGRSRRANPPNHSPLRRHTGRTSIPRCGCLILLSCLLAGCGDKGYETVPVSGRVTLDGKPLADVGLTFLPLTPDKKNPNVGPGSLGRTDAEGRFTLQTVNGEEGAIPAEHVVRMAMAFAPGGNSPDEFALLGSPPRKSLLPQSAQDGSLHFTVPPEGTERADFALRTEGSTPVTNDPKQ